MKNSSNELYRGDDYGNKNQTWHLEDAVRKVDHLYYILKKNSVTPNHIVDVGCGAGGVLEALSAKYPHAESFTGYDISPRAIEIARQNQTGRVRFLNEDFTNNTAPFSDVLLVIDVIEHIDDFYGFLRKLRHRSKYFVFHIPLDLCCRSVVKPHIMLQQREAVGHIHYFTKEMVVWFLSDLGYHIIDWIYTKPDIDVMPPQSFRAFLKKHLRSFSFLLNKDLSAKLWGGYSMMILAKQKLS